jgi:hypothetical protein
MKKINDHQAVHHISANLSVPGYRPREWVTRAIWQWEEPTQRLVVVYEDVDDEEFPSRDDYVRGTSTALYTYEALEEVGGVAQTKVTWTQKVGAGMKIPNFVQKRQGVAGLMRLGKMREKFDKSLAVDAARSLRLVAAIQNHEEQYTEEEEEILRVGKMRLELFRDGTTKVKKAKSLTPTVKNEIAFKKGDPLGWGRSETLVRATKEEVSAASE